MLRLLEGFYPSPGHLFWATLQKMGVHFLCNNSQNTNFPWFLHTRTPIGLLVDLWAFYPLSWQRLWTALFKGEPIRYPQGPASHQPPPKLSPFSSMRDGSIYHRLINGSRYFFFNFISWLYDNQVYFKQNPFARGKSRAWPVIVDSCRDQGRRHGTDEATVLAYGLETVQLFQGS